MHCSGSKPPSRLRVPQSQHAAAGLLGGLLLLSLGCSGLTYDPSPAVDSDPAEVSGDSGVASSPDFPVQPCQPEEAAFTGVGLGFPRSADRLRAVGTIEVVVLFADFPDAPASQTPDEILSILQPTAPDFFRDVSGGRMELVLRAHPVWLRMSQDSTAYGQAIREFAGHRDWLQEAVDLADEDVDFTGAELVLLMATPSADKVGYGPTWMGYSGQGGVLKADGMEITNGITSGADLLHWGGIWLNHEMGHSMSLVDLYRYGGDGGFTRPFSLMDLISSEAPEFFAYERWFLGWLDDAQVVCLPQSQSVELSAVEVEGGSKAVMVPLGETKILVVESRRALGWDAALDREGAVVYTVDTSIASGSGTIQVLNNQRALQEGESLTFEGATVRVEAAGVSGDRVWVAVP